MILTPVSLLPIPLSAKAQASPLQRLCVRLLQDVFAVQQLVARHPRVEAWQQAMAADRVWLNEKRAQMNFETCGEARRTGYMGEQPLS